MNRYIHKINAPNLQFKCEMIHIYGTSYTRSQYGDRTRCTKQKPMELQNSLLRSCILHMVERNIVINIYLT